MKNGHFSSVSLSRHPVQLVMLISFFFSPASDAGVLPPLWRGRVLPFTVQSRDHLATITDIYVPSFSYVHSPAFNAGFLRRSFRRLMSSGLLGGRVDRRTPLFIYLTHAYVCIFQGKGVRPSAWSTLYLLYSSNFGAKIGIKKRVSNFGTRLGMTVLFRY